MSDPLSAEEISRKLAGAVGMPVKYIDPGGELGRTLASLQETPPSPAGQATVVSALADHLKAQLEKFRAEGFLADYDGSFRRDPG